MANPAAPTVSATSGTLDFKTTGQDIFGPGDSGTLTVPLIGAGISGSFNKDDLNGSIAVSAGLSAVLSNATGNLAAEYPVNAGISMPSIVSPGQQFTVNTVNYGLDQAIHSATLTPTFPTSAGADVVLNISGSASLGFHTNTPILDLLNRSLATGPINISDTLISVSQTGSSVPVPIPPPLNGSFVVGVPEAYVPGAVTVVNGGSSLPSLTIAEQTTDLISGNTDLFADILPIGAGKFADFYPTLGISAGPVQANITFQALIASGGIDFAQEFTFEPTAIDANITAHWSNGKSATDTVKLGQAANFTVPTDQSALTPVSLTTTYTLTGTILERFGIAGQFALDAQQWSGTVAAGPYSASFGPLINTPIPVGFDASTPDYLSTAKFSLGGFSPISPTASTISVGVGAVFGPSLAGSDTVPIEATAVVGGGTVGAITAFSANAGVVVEAALDKSDSADTGTNIYVPIYVPPGPYLPGGSPTPISGDLNVEIFGATTSGKPVTAALTSGFTAGFLQPSSSNNKLLGNSADVVLAAAPGPGFTDTVQSVDETDTLVGGASGHINFLITSSFSGEIAGLQLADAIDLTNVTFNSGTAALGANNLLTLTEGGNSYAIKLDPEQNFGNVGFTVAADGSGGTAITFGTVVSAGKNMTIANGELVSGIDIFKGGSAIVDQGGIAIGTVMSGGALFVGRLPPVFVTPIGPAIASGTIIYSGAAVSVTTGLAVGTVIHKGGKETIAGSGTVDIGAAVSAGAVLDVISGGLASGTIVYSGGVLSAQGSVSVLSAQGSVSSGTGSGAPIGNVHTAPSLAYLDGAMVESGGKAVVSAGGAADGTMLSAGALAVAAGGTATGTIVAKGGTETVLAGGIASGTLIYSGGIAVVSSGGTAIGSQIAKGGTLTIDAHGSAGPQLSSLSGIVLSPLTTSDGGQVNVYGHANYTEVESGGMQKIYAGGVASSTHVEFGGQEIISSGGTDLQVTNDGTLTVLKGATVGDSGDTGQEDIYGTALGSVDIVSGFQLFVTGGTEIDAGGILTVHSGASAGGTVIAGGGVEFVSSGGTVSGVVLEGGEPSVVSGVTNSANPGGTLILQAGAKVEGPIDFYQPNVFEGGATLQIDGTVMPTNVIAGFSYGGTISNTIDLPNLAFHSGGTVTFGSTTSTTTLTITEGAKTATLNFDPTSGTPAYGQTMELENDGHGGTQLDGGTLFTPLTAGATIYVAPEQQTPPTVVGGAHNLIVATLNETEAYAIVGGSNDTIDVSNLGYQDQGNDGSDAIIYDKGTPITDTVIGFSDNPNYHQLFPATQLYFPGEANAYTGPNTKYIGDTNEQEVLATATQVGSNTVLIYPDGSKITFAGVSLSTITTVAGLFV